MEEKNIKIQEVINEKEESLNYDIKQLEDKNVEFENEISINKSKIEDLKDMLFVEKFKKMIIADEKEQTNIYEELDFEKIKRLCEKNPGCICMEGLCESYGDKWPPEEHKSYNYKVLYVCIDDNKFLSLKKSEEEMKTSDEKVKKDEKINCEILTSEEVETRFKQDLYGFNSEGRFTSDYFNKGNFSNVSSVEDNIYDDLANDVNDFELYMQSIPIFDIEKIEIDENEKIENDSSEYVKEDTTNISETSIDKMTKDDLIKYKEQLQNEIVQLNVEKEEAINEQEKRRKEQEEREKEQEEKKILQEEILSLIDSRDNLKEEIATINGKILNQNVIE